MASYLQEYFEQAAQREKLGIPPLALTEDFTKELCSLLLNPPVGAEKELLHLLKDRINPGVDASSKVKAQFLYEGTYQYQVCCDVLRRVLRLRRSQGERG